MAFRRRAICSLRLGYIGADHMAKVHAPRSFWQHSAARCFQTVCLIPMDLCNVLANVLPRHNSRAANQRVERLLATLFRFRTQQPQDHLIELRRVCTAIFKEHSQRHQQGVLARDFVHAIQTNADTVCEGHTQKEMTSPRPIYVRYNFECHSNVQGRSMRGHTMVHRSSVTQLACTTTTSASAEPKSSMGSPPATTSKSARVHADPLAGCGLSPCSTTRCRKLAQFFTDFSAGLPRPSSGSHCINVWMRSFRWRAKKSLMAPCTTSGKLPSRSPCRASWYTVSTTCANSNHISHRRLHQTTYHVTCHMLIFKQARFHNTHHTYQKASQT